MMGLEEIKKANEDPEKYYRQRLSDGQKKLDPSKCHADFYGLWCDRCNAHPSKCKHRE